jgi:hypothetical protein
MLLPQNFFDGGDRRSASGGPKLVVWPAVRGLEQLSGC